MPPSLQPQDVVGEDDLRRGLRLLLYDGMCSQAMVTLTQGPILVGFAVLLGASNAAIGLIAAVGPLSNVLQVPAIFWMERYRRRKRAVVLSCLLSRGLLIPLALVPWLVPAPLRVSAVVAILAVQFAFAAVSVCGFLSWMHDLIPSGTLNRFFAHRMTWSMTLGAVLSLASGVGLDLWSGGGRDPAAAYLVLFVLGAVVGYVGCAFLSRIPEPRMESVSLGSARMVIAEPFRDRRFRPLLLFVGAWTFAANLAIPFFAVYLIRRMELAMAWVLALAVLSQAAHATSLRPWGRVAERRGNPAVLAMAVPLFAVSAALWPFATAAGEGALRLGILAVIHALAGVALAGVTLCTGNLALREAPKGRGTAYLATNSLVAGLAATAAPLLAGAAADRFSAGDVLFTIGPIVANRLDGVFLVSAVLSLLTFRAALHLHEKAGPSEPLDLPALWGEAMRGVLNASSVAGFRRLVGFPYSRLRALFARRDRDVTASRDDGTRGSSPPPAAP